MIYWAHLVGRRAAALLPLTLSYRLAALGGSLVYGLWPEKRRHAVANMARVVGPGRPPREARRLARGAFRNYGKYLADMMRLDGWQIKEVERRLRVDGIEHVEAALARGHGLTFVCGHLRNADLGRASP